MCCRRSVMLHPADAMTTLLFLLLTLSSRTSTHSRHASVTVDPNRSQYFEYENISVNCGRFSSGWWKVWRYTTKGLQLSQCGSGWGACNMRTVKPSSSGVYWCESTHRDSSNAVNITITNKPVILESPALPVMEGDDIILRCRTKSHSDLPADFYRNHTWIRTEPAGHMTLRHVSRSDEGEYSCVIRDVGESPSSWLLLRDDSQPVNLTVSPDSAQLFEYDNFFLSCGDHGSGHGWQVVRFAASGGKVSSCGKEWGTTGPSSCHFPRTKRADSAVYWCESPSRQRSNSINITVYVRAATPVILQGPALPVMEGDDVTLRCVPNTNRSLPAAFYKDDDLIGTAPTGHMTLRHVSTSDEGLYRCQVTNHVSPPSWLLVRGPDDPASLSEMTRSVLWTILRIVICSPYFISTVFMVSLYRPTPTGRKAPVSTTTSPPNKEDEGSDQQYDDIIAGITTEHRF